MGVYGMLALALLVFCLRYLLRPEDWSERLVGFSFWALNIGLVLMVFANLFPLGILQLGDVVTNGYWHARSIEFFRDARADRVAAAAGRRDLHRRAFPLVYLTGRGRLPAAAAGRPGPPPGLSVESPLFTEVTAGAVGAVTAGRREALP